MEYLAAERSEVLDSAFGVHTLDSGDVLGVVPALHKALHRLPDAFQSEPAQPVGELAFVARDDLTEMSSGESLKRARSPLAVGARWRRIQGECQLICHVQLDGPSQRAALSPMSLCAHLGKLVRPVAVGEGEVQHDHVRRFDFQELLGLRPPLPFPEP